MAHVEYRSWLHLVKRIARDFISAPQPRILEIGAGTGALGSMLVDEGFAYHGSDRALAMCNQAKAKGLPFFCADGRCLPLRTGFDLVLFLYDGINYLLDAHDYARLFLAVHEALAPGGFFLFDVTTEANSRQHFYDFLDFNDYGDHAYVRHSYYDPSSRRQHNEFTVFSRVCDHPGQRLFRKDWEHHVQGILSVTEIRKRIPERLFGVVGIWDGFTFKDYSQRSERIHFFLRKAASS